jgi:hypothetical protein
MLNYCLKIEKQLLYFVMTSKEKLYEYGLGEKSYLFLIIIINLDTMCSSSLNIHTFP